MQDTRHFYRDLPTLETFTEAIRSRNHASLPEDWWVVIADVVGSTRAIEQGQYKKVNTVGVATIAAIANIDRSVDIPFVFGGDGATFGIPGALLAPAQTALRGAQLLARDSFGLDLRVGLVRVADLRARGFWVNLAKVRLSPSMTQTSLSGRGWEEAERMVKSGAAEVIALDPDQGEAHADFDGFECRWHSVASFNGHKLAILVTAMSDDPAVNLATYQEVIARIHAIYGEERDFHPLRPRAMHLSFNPATLSHEMRVRSPRRGWLARLGYLLRLLLLNLAGSYLFARNIDTAATQWSRYRDDLVDNTDFRKFDGVLRMVIDGNDDQFRALEDFLESRHRERKLVFGLYRSREALVTCLVQSYNGNHLHFVDGSDGGYAMAARGLKAQIKRFHGTPA